jgi:hypothetical protein
MIEMKIELFRKFRMETGKMKKIIIMIVAVMAIAGFHTQAQASVVVDLGTAADFAVLGGSGVTNTGTSTFTGDVGSSPTPAVTGITPVMVTGTLYLAANAATANAHTDLITAYNAAHDATGGVAGPADLGGAILAPGVYIYGAAPWTAGTLTLNGTGYSSSAQWIFQIDSTLITPAGAAVALINASANNVFWQVGSSATIGATNTFAGNILAQASIGFGGGTLNGRALAIDGAVTISVAETITIPEPATMALLGLGAVSLLRKKK